MSTGTRDSGALRILRYNAPVYVATWTLGVATLLLGISQLSTLGRLAWPGIAAGALALAWSAVSLAVSAYIYDHSPLMGGSWIPALLPSSVITWVTIHAGLDAEVELDAVMPGRCAGHLDIFDDVLMTAPSITRARGLTAQRKLSRKCAPTSLALDDRSCDVVVVAFTAHEIRDAAARERFFRELHRALRPGGRVIIVEHLRDLASFAVYGPGYLHFLPRREWLRLAAVANLRVAIEIRVTPWVTALSLERPV